jgi:hypothetical protein
MVSDGKGDTFGDGRRRGEATHKGIMGDLSRGDLSRGYLSRFSPQASPRGIGKPPLSFPSSTGPKKSIEDSNGWITEVPASPK